MAVFKCKMCGGTLEVNEGQGIGVCEYCGTTQTLPRTTDETIANLFNRANNLRLKCEFDKAEQIYEKIVERAPEEAEAHWGMVLCRYGIEYVEDPKTLERIPTCHRTSYEAVSIDPDYLSAMEKADDLSRVLYEKEAKRIDALQKDILAIVADEKPFDVFICYKETDEDGKRTQDSAYANDIYYQLTQEGFKVFYAAITLEDKLGHEYEPYIFAALNSAKVMLAVGTNPEYFNAVWVKNEWSRYIKLIKTDRSRLLIPCYKDMDAYDLPEEFAHLQAQDMGKIGFINDLVRGIKKVVRKETAKPVNVEKPKMEISLSAPEIAPLLERAHMFLEDGEFENADEYAEKVLDREPKNAYAYLIKLMAEFKVSKKEVLKDCFDPFDESQNYLKIVRYGDSALKDELDSFNDHIRERNKLASLSASYEKACEILDRASHEEDYIKAFEMFHGIVDFKDSNEKAEECKKRINDLRMQADYEYALRLYNSAVSPIVLDGAEKIFLKIGDYRDSIEMAKKCHDKFEEIEKNLKMEAERRKKLQKTLLAVGIGLIATVVLISILLVTVIVPNIRYADGVHLYELGEYEEAAECFRKVYGRKDSKSYYAKCYQEMYVDDSLLVATKEDMPWFDTNGMSTLLKGKKEPPADVVIPNVFDGIYIKHVGGKAFEDMDEIKTVTISGILKIDQNAFLNCDALTTVTMSGNVTHIGSGVFYDCDELTTVNLSRSLTRIGSRAFASCEKLTTINYAGTMAEWEEITKAYDWDENIGSYTVHCIDGDIQK